MRSILLLLLTTSAISIFYGSETPLEKVRRTFRENTKPGQWQRLDGKRLVEDGLIGFRFHHKEGAVIKVVCVPDKPIEGGLEAGDEIVAIDRHVLRGRKSSEIWEFLSPPVGTEMVIDIVSVTGEKKRFAVRVLRESVTDENAIREALEKKRANSERSAAP